MYYPEDCVSLTRQDGSQVDIHLYGATVMSWRLKGVEHLFVSVNSKFDNKTAIRGGIPLVFPNFSTWDCGPKHGFARIRRWKLERAPWQDPAGNISVVLSLKDDDFTRGMWNHQFELHYTVTLLEEGITCSFAVTNTDDHAWDFTCLLHNYFKCPDIGDVCITGLEGISYVDKTVDPGVYGVEDRKEVRIRDNVDKIYGSTLAHEIKHVAGGRTMVLAKAYLPDTVVWNPWKELAEAMVDMDGEEYKQFVCVEAGYVVNRKVLGPGQTFTGSQTITTVVAGSPKSPKSPRSLTPASPPKSPTLRSYMTE